MKRQRLYLMKYLFVISLALHYALKHCIRADIHGEVQKKKLRCFKASKCTILGLVQTSRYRHIEFSPPQ